MHNPSATDRPAARPVEVLRRALAPGTRSSPSTLSTGCRVVAAGDSGRGIRFAIGESSLGAVLVAGGERGVRAITLGDDPDALVRDLLDRLPHATQVGDDTAAVQGAHGVQCVRCMQWVAQVVAAVDAPRQPLRLPLDIRGTAFQRGVWQALQRIPVGHTESYREVAVRIGAPKAVRAVARACAANPLAVVIPCHRVVRSDGALSGYRWGVERKRALLDRESRR